jgi:fused signal recognition particle receptor
MKLFKIILLISILVGLGLIYKKFFYKKKNTTLTLNQEINEKIKKILINNDMSLSITNKLLEDLCREFKGKCTINDLKTFVSSKLKSLLANNIGDLAALQEVFYKDNYGRNNPLVFLLLGNNGVGKTSFAMKLAKYFIKKGVAKEKILVTSLDFFRAGASQQLQELCESISVKYLIPKNNSKGQAYDTYMYGKNNEYDIIIFDTSGRIHTNDNLLEEIKDIMKTLSSLNAHMETIMVMDNNFGGISINSFEAFNNITNISGLVLTKTDSQIGGGWLIKLVEKYSQIKLFGCGNGISADSFVPFNVEEYGDKIVNWRELDE